MKNPKLTLILALSLVSAGLHSGHGQDEAITISFRAISLDKPIEELSLITDNALVECPIPSRRRSPTIKYTGGAVMRFVEKGEVIPAEGGLAALPSYLEVPVVTSYSNPLYIFYPKPEGEEQPYGVFTIEDSPRDFEGGASMFINLSPYSIILLLGEDGKERIELSPKQNHTHSFDGGNVNVRLRIASFSEGDAYKGMDTRIFPITSHRDVYFIYPVSGGEVGQVRMRLLREHLNTAARAYRPQPVAP